MFRPTTNSEDLVCSHFKPYMMTIVTIYFKLKPRTLGQKNQDTFLIASRHTINKPS